MQGMISLRGRAVRGGVAIAAGAVIREKTGIAGVSPDILQHGVDALRQQLAPGEYPEAAAVCDVASAAEITIPGVNIIGIAAESDTAPEESRIEVPCVVGVLNLLASVSAGDIVIVDGDSGLVHIDPDPKMLISYQNKEEIRLRSRAFFIESKHIPARTQDGHVVSVWARAASANAVALAVENGADGLVVEPFEPLGAPCYETALSASLGKPVAFLAGFADRDLLLSVLRLAAPDQVSVYFPLAHFAALERRMEHAIEQMEPEPLRTGEFGVLTPHQQEMLDRPRIIIGAQAGAGQEPNRDEERQPAAVLVDLRALGSLENRLSAAESLVRRWTSEFGAEHIVFDVGERLRLLRRVIEAGARAVATSPEKVGRFKDAVRAVRVEDEQ